MQAIVMPKLGLTMTEGSVVKWMKQVGETVAAGESVVEIATEKITYTIDAPADGTLLNILVQEGEDAPVAATIGWLGAIGEALTNVHKPSACSDSTDDARLNDAAIAGGQFTHHNEEQTNLGSQGTLLATPLAKRLARESSTDLSLIEGSGPAGRVQASDVERFLERIKRETRSTPAADAIARANAVPLEDIAPSAERVTSSDVIRHLSARPARSECDFIRHSPMRKSIARRMTESWTTIPHVTLTRRVDVHGLLTCRKQLETISSSHISLTALIACFVSRVLEKHPLLNAHYGREGCRTFHDVHLGIAVSIDDGLVVPVIKEANRKTVVQISDELEMLTERAREGSLLAEDMEGGTFTVSSLGMFGIDGFTPIILPPQTGILGVGQMNHTAHVRDGVLDEVPEITFSLSFDHRAIDGVYGARFLAQLAQWCAEPLSILL